MPIRATAETKYLYYPVFHRVIQHSADGGKALPTRVVSSTKGPFNFSSAVSPSAVTLQLKAGNGDWLNATVNLSSPAPAGGITSVTASELVSAINATELGIDLFYLTTESGDQLITESGDLLACSTVAWQSEVESTTNFLKLFITTPGTLAYVQVRGEVADLTGIMAQIFKGDTQKAFGVTQKMKGSESLDTTDSTGMTTSAVARAYRKGSSPLLIDTAMSKELRAAIEGGSLITVPGYTAKQYDPPGPESFQPVVSLEAFFAIFAKNDNRSTAPIGYLWNRYDSCKGTCGDIVGDRNAQYWSYLFEAVPYRDPVTGIQELTDEHSQELTVAEYAALDVFNV